MNTGYEALSEDGKIVATVTPQRGPKEDAEDAEELDDEGYQDGANPVSFDDLPPDKELDFED